MDAFSSFVSIYFLVYLSSLLLFFIVGGLFLSFLNTGIQGFFEIIFWRLFAGINITVLAFSLFSTGGVSIHLFFLLLLGIGFWLYQDRIYFQYPSFKNMSVKNGLGNLLSYTGIFLVACLLFFWRVPYLFTESNETYFNLTGGDVVFFSKVSEYIFLTGNENVWQVGNLIDTHYEGTTPYHYYELWLNAWIFQSFGLKSLLCLESIVYPIAWFLFFVGLMGLGEKSGIQSHFSLIVLGFLMVFSRGIYTIEFLSGILSYYINPINFNKISYLQVFLIPVFYQLISREWKALWLFAMAAIIVYFSAIAGILSGLCFFAMILWLCKTFNTKEFFIYIGSCICFFLLYVFFNFFTRSEISLFDLGQASLYQSYNSWMDLRTSINIIGGTSLQLALLFCIPGFLVALFLWLDRKKIDWRDWFYPLGISFSIVFGGLLTWAFFYKILDSFQLFQNIALILINTLFIKMYWLMYKSGKIGWRIIVCAILFFQFYTASKEQFEYIHIPYYSDSYINQLKSILEKENLNPIGVSMFAKKDFEEMNSYYINHKFSINSNAYVLGAQLKLIENYYNTICISVFDTPNQEDPLVQSFTRSSAFYLFTKALEKEGRFVSIEQSQLEFINRFEVDYIIISKYVVLSPLISSKIKTVIEDAVTGEKFIILRK